MIRMATFWSYRVFFMVFMLGLAVVTADKESDLKEFVELKDEVFGVEFNNFPADILGDKICKMIELTETGNILAEVQGNIKPEYLKALIADCQPKTVCNLEEDRARVERLRSRKQEAPDFQTYLGSCISDILTICAQPIYDKATKRLNSLKENDQYVLRKVASLTSKQLKRDKRFAMKDYEILLTVLASVYPRSARKVANDEDDPEGSLKKLMNKVRQPCLTLMKNLDPIAEMFPSLAQSYKNRTPSSKLMMLNYEKDVCKQLLDEWGNIVEKASLEYEEYFFDAEGDESDDDIRDRDSFNPRSWLAIILAG